MKPFKGKEFKTKLNDKLSVFIETRGVNHSITYL